MRFEKEIAAALPAIAQTCLLCLSARRKGFADAEKKKDKTPVTAADYAAQFILTKTLRKTFPRDEIVAEESPDLPGGTGGGMLAKILQLLPGENGGDILETLGCGAGNAHAKRFWTIDPIDGTAGFIRGAQFAVAVALVEEGEVSLGFLGCPGLGFIMHAARDLGLYKTGVDGSGGKRIFPQKPREEKIVLCETAAGTPDAYGVSGKIIRGAASLTGKRTEAITMDGQCKYALVAERSADVFLRVPNSGGRRENIWDHAAGAVIAGESGAEVSDFDGAVLDFSTGAQLARNRGIVAAAREIHGDIINSIQKAEI